MLYVLFVLLDQESNTYQPSVSPFGDSRPRCPSQDAPQQDHRRGALTLSAATYGPPLQGGAWGGRSPPLLGGNVVTA
eukprot:2812879-Prymnesium_polylepis.2